MEEDRELDLVGMELFIIISAHFFSLEIVLLLLCRIADFFNLEAFAAFSHKILKGKNKGKLFHSNFIAYRIVP